MRDEQDSKNGPLTPEHTVQLAVAMERVEKIRKASKMAAVNGWVLGISAALTAFFAPFSPVAFLLLIALGTLSWNEFRGGKMLQAFEEKGPDILWKNQLGLMAVVAAYCIWGIRTAAVGPVNPSLAELQELAPEVVELMADLTIVVYAVVLAVTVLLQGVMARFYHLRIALVREYTAETPEWIVEVGRMMEGGASGS